MRLYRQYLKVYLKNRLLAGASACMVVFSFYQLVHMYLQWPDLTVNPLEVTLKLSKYVFIFFLIVSYVFFTGAGQVSMEECVQATASGKRRRHYLMQLAVVSSAVLLLTLLLFIYNTAVFEIISRQYDRQGFGFDYIFHIFQCLFVYIFLIGELAAVIGAALHRIGNRLVGYGLILLIIFVSGPYLEKIVNTLMDTAGLNLFSLRNYFDIFPINLSFVPNPAFGFSVLPYKVAIIVFWLAVFCLGLIFAFRLKRKLICAVVAGAVCVASISVYSLPCSKVVMDNSPQGSAMHDMFYYAGRTDLKEEAAEFSVKKYTLDFRIGRQLEASAVLDLSDPQLEEYRFTLYHDYIVERVTNQDGEELPFRQDSDYISVQRGKAPTKQLNFRYGGAAKAYYANQQGIYLTGDFQYYPVAGYLKLADPEDGMLIRQFLKEDAEFDVTVKNGRQVFSNLEETEKNHFSGRSNGLTLMAGLLSEERMDGNKIIYPTYEDNKRGDYINTLELLKKNGYENCTFVVVPNMNQGGTFTHMSREQIVSVIPFFAGEEFEQDWNDMLRGESR